MMNLSPRSSNAIPDHHSAALAVVVACVPLLLLQGCGIPPLRHAEPGAAVPQFFEDADNLQYFNQADYADAFDESIVFVSCAKPVITDDTHPADIDATADPGRRLSLDSAFHDPANWLALKHPDNSHDDGSNEGVFFHADFTEPNHWPGHVDDPQDNPPDTFASHDATFVNDQTPDLQTPDLPAATPYYDDDGTPYRDDGTPYYDDGTSYGTDNAPLSWNSSSSIPWNEFFNDPILTDLVNQALLGNQELKILGQEVRIASLEVQARSGEYLPFVNVGAGAGLEKPGLFTRNGAVEEQLEILPGKDFPEPLPDFLVAANLSWEIDIWRKLRNARDAAALRYLGTREGQNYVATRLVAEVAENYFELLALDNRLATLDQTIAIQQQSLIVAERKKAAAAGTELAVQRFQAEVRKNQSEKLIIHQEIIETENRINFLLGRYPQHIARNSAGYLDFNLPPLATGVPSQLIQNRSDVRQAERKLAAAGLDVKVARARFYPSLELHAGVGYQAFNPKYLFWTPESLIYNVAGDLVAPLINKRAIKADYLTANATQIQSVYEYQRTILKAFTEVINRMAKVENYGQSIEIKKQQLEALETSVRVATNLFQNARAEYVEVLLAQRDLMEAKMVLIETKQQQLNAVVNAYQALGGGGVQFSFDP